MSSARLPGKVLEDIGGKPMIQHVFDRVAAVFSIGNVFVLTSADPSDDSLCAYLSRKDIPFIRGPLDDVLGRFNKALDSLTPSPEWIMRISCDSPLISSTVINQVLSARSEKFEIVTNIFPRSFPKGQSVELVHANCLKKLNTMVKDPAQREHVTKYIYDNPKSFKILNVSNEAGNLSDQNDCVDTFEDLEKIRERMSAL
jgi:spore coat polysaccharide biosynthesis protein SpsF (cytidylyltransferase family)